MRKDGRTDVTKLLVDFAKILRKAANKYYIKLLGPRINKHNVKLSFFKRVRRYSWLGKC